MVNGSCLCGKIKYEVEIIKERIFNCHCQYCRKAHGADYATIALAKGSTLKVTDDDNQLKEHLNEIGGYRAFCSHCGSRLMSYAPDKNEYLGITMSTIDTPLDITPIANVNTESKAAWCVLSDISSFEGLPDIK